MLADLWVRACLSVATCFVHVDVIQASSVRDLPDEVIPELYTKYREAIAVGQNRSSARRIFAHDTLYEVHVRKLKEVSGFKIHNLMVKADVRSNNQTYVYINNPVESKLPNAYLTLDEFKSALTNRIQAQKDELTAKKPNLLKTYSITKKDVRTKTDRAKVHSKTRTKKKELTSKVDDVVKISNAIHNTVSTKPIVHKRLNKSTIRDNLLKTDTEMLHTRKKEKLVSTESTVSEITKEKSSQGLFVGKELITQNSTVKQSRLYNEGVLEKLKNSPVPQRSNVSETTESMKQTVKDKGVLKDITTTEIFTVMNVTFNDLSTERMNGNNSSTNSESTPNITVLNTNGTMVTKEITKMTPKRSRFPLSSKINENSTTKSINLPRSTLGRPLVYMG